MEISAARELWPVKTWSFDFWGCPVVSVTGPFVVDCLGPVCRGGEGGWSSPSDRCSIRLGSGELAGRVNTFRLFVVFLQPFLSSFSCPAGGGGGGRLLNVVAEQFIQGPLIKSLRKRREDTGSFAIIQAIICMGIPVVTKVQATKTTKKRRQGESKWNY